jgi:ferrous iron transport protein A
MLTTLDRLSAGETAVVHRLRGGHGMQGKLDALGVRPGKRVRMVSSQFMAGPITVLMDGRQMAMGRGIARKVVVRVGD